MAGAKKAKPEGTSRGESKAKAKPKETAGAKPKTAESKPKKADAARGPAARKPARPKSAAAKPRSKSHSSPDTYTDPALRDRLKEEITAGDKGGKPGQWSARKAQLLAHEYEKQGGGYKNGAKKKTEGQKHLDEWTGEDWKTADGRPADREGGTARYLPAEAWDELTPAQKKATNAKKQAGSRRGKQFVPNTDEAKDARKAAAKSDGDEGEAPKEPAGAKPKRKPPAKPKSEGKSKPKAKSASGSGAKPKSEGKSKPKAKSASGAGAKPKAAARPKARKSSS